MKQQPDIEQLKRVKKVAAPPFLLTRIQAKIEENNMEHLAPQWKWAGVLAIALMLFMNIFVVNLEQQNNTQSEAMEMISEGMGLFQSNQLYHE